MMELEIWAAVVGALAAIVTLWWSIAAQTREIRAGRADDLRRRLLHAKGAAADAWDVVRNGESLVQIGSSIAAEARERLSASGPRDRALHRLADDRTRAEIASFGWYRSPRASDLRHVRSRLANSQSDLTGNLRMVSGALSLFVSLLDATHFPQSFKNLLDGFSTNATKVGLKEKADADDVGGRLEDILSDAAFVRFFGQKHASSGAASAGDRTHYSLAYCIERFVHEAVGYLILLDDRALTTDSDAREPVTRTHTAEIRHQLEQSRLGEPEKNHLRELVDLIQEALPEGDQRG